MNVGGGQSTDFLCRSAAPLREVADFACDHGESTAMFAGAGRFDGSIQGQHVSLIGDLFDDGNFLRDRFHCGNRFLDGLAALPGVLSAFARRLLHFAAVFGVLRDGSAHLFHAAGYLFDSGGLFAGALRNDAGGGSDLRGSGTYRTSAHAHFADHFVELAGHLGHSSEEAPELIAAIGVDGLG